MTVTEPVRVFDKGMEAPVEIRGKRIGFGTSENDEKLRWAEVRVYALEGGGYLAHRTGYSLVYHRADTTCMTREQRRRGDPASVDDLPDDAEPCPDCKPPAPRDLPDGQNSVRYEFPRHTFDEGTPEHVVERLTVIRNRNGSVSVHKSQPVSDCLAQCARSDPAFAKFAPAPVTYGGQQG